MTSVSQLLLPRPVVTTGYTNVPNAIEDLGLSPREEQLVKRLLKYRWTPESPIHVRIAVLAESMHCCRRTVERAIAGLVERGLLRVEHLYRNDGGLSANQYILGPELTTAVLSDGRAFDVAALGEERRTPTTAEAQQKNYSGKAIYKRGKSTILPAPIEPNTCFGCGGPHRSAVCPKYPGAIKG